MIYMVMRKLLQVILVMVQVHQLVQVYLSSLLTLIVTLRLSLDLISTF